MPPRCGSFIPGLLDRLRQPSVAQSAWSFGGNGKGIDPADCASGGLLPSRQTLTSSLNPWSARYDIVREVVLCRMIGGAQCQTPHVPSGRRFFEEASCCGIGCVVVRASRPHGDEMSW